MKNTRYWMLAGASALTLVATAAAAQTTAAGADSPASAKAKVDDTVVVVTARRKNENLQNVPTTVSAVTGESIKKLALTQFQDVQAVVPGLTLGVSNVTSGRTPAPSIRGVSYDASTGAAPTVDIYQNDVPIGGDQAFQAMYDMQGIEVIRGPQGTVRGRTAPSGAITLTTRRADTRYFGGYFSALASDHDARNLQGALNVPIINGVLGMRIAGVHDENEGDFVKSVHNSENPLKSTSSGRASLYFTPTSNFDANITYQGLDVHNRQFTQVEGPGAPGGVSSAAPAGYNGPAITSSQRLGVTDDPRITKTNYQLWTGQVNWTLGSNRLSYVGGYDTSKGLTHSDIDYGNNVIGHGFYQDLNSRSKQTTHELRLTSVGSDRLFDYTLGYYYQKSSNLTTGGQPASFLAGTFGNPANPADPTVFNSQYMLPTIIYVNNQSTEKSFYANGVLHLGKTEISAGYRHIVSDVNNAQIINLGAGMIATKIGFPCSFAHFASTFGGGYCDVPIAASTTPVQNATEVDRKSPSVYNLSISHRFSDNVLAYGTYATSWRRGANNISLANADSDPVLSALTFLPDESSTSYESGIKTNWFAKRLRLNLAIFDQKFNGLMFQEASIPYLAANGAQTQVQSTTINIGANSIVKGFDFDGAYQITPNWSLSGGLSYADGKVANALVPCRDSNFDGVPDTGLPTASQFQAHNAHIAECKTNQSVSRDPLWNANATTEYWRPVGNVEAYVRALATYYPQNTRRNLTYLVPAYSLVNLYAGVRSPDGDWDLGFYVRNLFNTGATTSLEPDPTPSASNAATYFGSSGYYFTSYTPPREVGIQLRYAFGSR